MSDEMRTEGTGLAIPGAAALEKIPQTDVVAMLLDTAGTIKLTEEQREIVFTNVDPDLVEIREDGIVYLPAVEYKGTLCSAFGLEWAIVPESPKPVEVDGVILWGFHLFIQGQPVAFAWGEQQYKKGSYMMSYGDAMEGAKSNAIMRLCKQVGIAQDLWRPSFIRKWKQEHAEEYEGQDRNGNKRMLWRRLEHPNQVETEDAGDVGEESELTGNVDRFRRTAFLMIEFLKIDEKRMKAECKEKFGVESRATLEPSQWKEYRDYLKENMTEAQAADYDAWLDVRSAMKPLAERGMDKKELVFYLQTHFLRLDVLEQDIPEDLATRLKRSGASDKHYATLQKGVQRAKEWAESVGGAEEVEQLLGYLGEAMQDVTGEFSLTDFIQKMGIVEQEDGSCRLTGISPQAFAGWRAALGLDDNKPDPPAAAAKPEEEADKEDDTEPATTSGGDDTQAAGETPQNDAMPPASGEDIHGPEEIFLVTDQTIAAIREILLQMPDRDILKTIKSSAFHAFATAAIEHTYIGLRDILDSDGKLILNALKVELARLTGEIKEDFIDGVPGEPQTLAEMKDEYMKQIHGRFETVEDMTAFQSDTTGKSSFGDWGESEFRLALKALAEMDPGASEAKPETASPAEPLGGCMTDEQYKAIDGLLQYDPKTFGKSMGSQEIRRYISKLLKKVFSGMRKIAEDDADDVIKAMQDHIQDLENGEA